MAGTRMIGLESFVDKILEEGSPDFLREALSALAARVMEIEATRLTGAAKGERTEGRRDYRNGYRPRTWDTRVGSLELQVPKFRRQGYVPCFLEARRRGERALLSVVQEAYVHGVSTRKVEGLVQALGLDGVSKSEVSRMCEELDATVVAFRTRPLGPERFPYVWLDARYEKVRVDGRVVSQAVVVAYGVRESGEREVLGVDVGPSEDEAFWKQFLRALVERGLSGVKLAISDAHAGLRKAIGEVFSGAAWQRCRVHFMRNVLGTVPKRAQPWISAAVKAVFAQPTQEAARAELRKLARGLAKKHPRTAALLEEAAEDVLAYMSFPEAHWRQIHSTNPLERLNREIKRRTTVVGIFPSQASLLRLVGMLLIEQNEEWSIGRRYFSQESMAVLYPAAKDADELLLEGELAAP